MNTVHELDRRILPLLQKMANDLSRDFPDIQTNWWSSPTGSLTDYQGHDLGVECIFADSRSNNGRQVALVLGVKHLTTYPIFDGADIVWGTGAVEADFLPEPLEVNAESLDKIEESLSQMYEILRTAVQRGYPLVDHLPGSISNL